MYLIAETEGRGSKLYIGGYFAWMLICGIGSLIMAATAETVFQEIAALLFGIASNTFWGVCVLVGVLSRRQVIYSDLVARLEANIAHIESMQAHTTAVNGVADPLINAGQQMSLPH